MRQQGSCTLSADDSGRALDRLAGLEKIIPPALLRQVLDSTERVNSRSCRLTHDVMLWVVLATAVYTDLPIRQVFKQCRRFRPGERTPARSSLCEARQRLGAEPLAALHRLVVRPLATPDTRGAFYQEYRLMAMDGTVLDVPDSDANRAAFHRADGGRGTGAFPQVRKVSLFELGTHVEVAMAVGGWQDSESTLAKQILPRIPADALLLLDRGFFSYPLWQSLTQQNVARLMRVKTAMVFRPIRLFADGSYGAKIYSSSRHRKQDRDGVMVRVIDYTLDDPQRVGHGQPHRLITSLLDDQRFPATDLIVLYHERWESELVLDEQKTHHDPRRPGKAAHLRSETPAGVRQELLALSLAHFATRALMTEAARQEGIDSDRLSFIGCLRVLRCRLPECAAAVDLERWYQLLLLELRQELIEPRRNRINPRVVKRKMSKFAKKRPTHRGQPPLTKSPVPRLNSDRRALCSSNRDWQPGWAQL